MLAVPVVFDAGSDLHRLMIIPVAVPPVSFKSVLPLAGCVEFSNFPGGTVSCCSYHCGSVRCSANTDGALESSDAAGQAS